MYLDRASICVCAKEYILQNSDPYGEIFLEMLTLPSKNTAYP